MSLRHGGTGPRHGTWCPRRGPLRASSRLPTWRRRCPSPESLRFNALKNDSAIPKGLLGGTTIG